MAYRQPDREALDELDGHEERVRRILATVDQEEAALARRGRILRGAVLTIVSGASLAFIVALGTVVGWEVFLFASFFGAFVMGAAHLAKKIPPREDSDGPPAPPPVAGL
ncbi:MAG TPA: hypothetical protein ENK57_17395 [Polyangiaceae bacterium]|nr:hypothetical protein [Polyangiaceae bacterium]